MYELHKRKVPNKDNCTWILHRGTDRAFVFESRSIRWQELPDYRYTPSEYVFYERADTEEELMSLIHMLDLME